LKGSAEELKEQLPTPASGVASQTQYVLDFSKIDFLVKQSSIVV
jgi:hypothetical protein